MMCARTSPKMSRVQSSIQGKGWLLIFEGPADLPFEDLIG